MLRYVASNLRRFSGVSDIMEWLALLVGIVFGVLYGFVVGRRMGNDESENQLESMGCRLIDKMNARDGLIIVLRKVEPGQNVAPTEAYKYN